jgi:hypothetical protein
MIAVLDALFAPIARLAVARGLGFAQAADRLKAAYLRAAIATSGPAPTDSKISLLTGLQRRDVARLRGFGDAVTPRRVNHLSRLVALWLADPAYAGQPLPRRGPAPSFEALALAVRKDLHPKTLLDQLLAAGTIAETGDKLALLQTAYQPLSGTEAQLDYLGQNVGDHLAAAVSNVTGPARFLEQAVHYNHLTPDAVAELDALWRTKVTDALQQVNHRALDLQRAETGNQRFRAGAYFWEEDEA